jgi:hypothetical protein
LIHWRRLGGDHDARIDAVEQHGTRVSSSSPEPTKEGQRHNWAHVLKLQNGKIIDIQDYASPTRAAASTRLRAVFSGPLGSVMTPAATRLTSRA